MSTAEAPTMAFADGGLRISLFPTDDVDDEYVSNESPPVFQAELYGSEVTPSVTNGKQTLESNIPEHPIPSLQEAFAESLLEVTQGTGSKPSLKRLNAKGRRELLISQQDDADPYDALWRYRPSQNEHELLKLVAQISFGVYLLLNGMANNNAQVVNILQTHIDEVDEFLEVVLDDLTQAAEDLSGRIEHLQLPLTNMQVFEESLENPRFHAEILAGNKKIEHILARTNIMMKQWDDDVDCGLSCTAAFSSWLADQRDLGWRTEQPDLVDVFEAMEGNVDGWLNAFDDMQDQAQEINELIIRMMTIVAELEKKAGEVSRKTLTPRSVYNADASSLSSAISSRQSHGNSTHQTSWSGSPETKSHPASVQSDEEDDHVEYPLPGGLPLLPPTSSPPRANMGPQSVRPLQLPTITTTARSPGPDEKIVCRPVVPRSVSVPDKVPMLLQPRTYSPQPSMASQSPSLREAPTSSWQPSASSPPTSHPLSHSQSMQGPLTRKKSLRDRVHNPPDDIQIPLRPAVDESMRRPTLGRLTSQASTPQLRGISYSSNRNTQSPYQHSRDGSNYDITPPPNRSQLTASPQSDQYQQFYRPVHASPHSPLQQRPHTAVGQPRPNGQAIHHQRNQPSRFGAASTLSATSVSTYDSRAPTPSVAPTTNTQLKKKKSAFGWFKKAFSMDEEERAAFEARKAMQHQDRYYDTNSPRFLDGKRIR